ncbi:hypothetical protein E0Z10_g9893 [Xylaria hypoxylon]|uniref:DUF1993 domain-containing protein n=1 Tax=Xylaria hypoxylon TaxID=37992 RepID=A0A4Z0YQL2_9PEZI|nr:hypothetical protein E0Z10_g9893 [Xylaria hypoxylon]
MTTLYDLTIPFLIKALKTEQNLLAKAEAFATEKGTPIAELLETRLAPDMWPLSQQIVIITLHAALAVLKLTGTPPPKINFGPAPLEDCKKYLAETLVILEAVTPESVNGKEEEIVGAMTGGATEAKMKALDYVEGYLKPNIYFHITTHYDILRSKGATLGKGDYLNPFVTIQQ